MAPNTFISLTLASLFASATLIQAANITDTTCTQANDCGTGAVCLQVAESLKCACDKGNGYALSADGTKCEEKCPTTTTHCKAGQLTECLASGEYKCPDGGCADGYVHNASTSECNAPAGVECNTIDTNCTECNLDTSKCTKCATGYELVGEKCEIKVVTPTTAPATSSATPTPVPTTAPATSSAKPTPVPTTAPASTSATPNPPPTTAPATTTAAETEIDIDDPTTTAATTADPVTTHPDTTHASTSSMTTAADSSTSSSSSSTVAPIPTTEEPSTPTTAPPSSSVKPTPTPTPTPTTTPAPTTTATETPDERDSGASVNSHVTAVFGAVAMFVLSSLL